MRGQVDTLNAYTRRRLEQWGEEFTLHRDLEWLGFASKNILQVLMEHKGMPGRAQGYKPIETDMLAQEVEDLVSELSTLNRPASNVLRAYYGGRGRRTVERFETANLLITHMGDRMISMRQYQFLRLAGENFVHDKLIGKARAA